MASENSTAIRIDRCAHGCFHLIMGPVSLRLSPEDYRRLAREVWRAWNALDGQSLPDSIDEHGVFHRKIET